MLVGLEAIAKLQTNSTVLVDPDLRGISKCHRLSAANRAGRRGLLTNGHIQQNFLFQKQKYHPGWDDNPKYGALFSIS